MVICTLRQPWSFCVVGSRFVERERNIDAVKIVYLELTIEDYCIPVGWEGRKIK